MSADMSLTHLADISVTPITVPAPVAGVVIAIDLISFGAGYDISCD